MRSLNYNGKHFVLSNIYNAILRKIPSRDVSPKATRDGKLSPGQMVLERPRRRVTEVRALAQVNEIDGLESLP
jgi:hypothetical protein